MFTDEASFSLLLILLDQAGASDLGLGINYNAMITSIVWAAVTSALSLFFQSSAHTDCQRSMAAFCEVHEKIFFQC